MNDKKALEVFNECMDELYMGSDPSVSWESIQTKYEGKERSEFYMKHCIPSGKYYEIVKKHKKRLNVFYKRQLAWYLLDYAPTFCDDEKGVSI